MEESSTPANHPLSAPDLMRVKAAECWLALGNLEEAVREIDHIPTDNREHPHVQRVCQQIRAAARYMERMISEDQILNPYWDLDAEEFEPVGAPSR